MTRPTPRKPARLVPVGTFVVDPETGRKALVRGYSLDYHVCPDCGQFLGGHAYADPSTGNWVRSCCREVIRPLEGREVEPDGGPS